MIRVNICVVLQATMELLLLSSYPHHTDKKNKVHGSFQNNIVEQVPHDICLPPSAPLTSDLFIPSGAQFTVIRSLYLTTAPDLHIVVMSLVHFLMVISWGSSCCLYYGSQHSQRFGEPEGS